jgi:hypothetical protein
MLLRLVGVNQQDWELSAATAQRATRLHDNAKIKAKIKACGAALVGLSE